MTLLANPPKFTSLSSARQIFHWMAHNSVNLEFTCFTYPFPPIHKYCNVWTFLLSLVINNSSMKRFPMLIHFTNPKSCVKYIPLLCWIWPGFKQKSSLFLPKESWNDTNTCALIFLLDFSWWWDQNYSSANYMHCSTKLSATEHNSQFHIRSFFRLSSWA